MKISEKIKTQVFTKKYFKRNVQITIGLLLIMVIFAIRTDFSESKEYYEDFYGLSSNVPLGELSIGTTVIQDIPYDGESGISILFATYSRENEGNVHISVVGKESGWVYSDETLDAGLFKDNSYLDISYDENMSQLKDSDVELRISSDSPIEKAITIWLSSEDVIPGYDLCVNDQVLSNEIIYRKFNFNYLNKVLQELLHILQFQTLYFVWIILVIKLHRHNMLKEGILAAIAIFLISYLYSYSYTYYDFISRFAIPTIPILGIVFLVVPLCLFSEKKSKLWVGSSIFVYSIFVAFFGSNVLGIKGKMIYYFPLVIVWIVIPVILHRKSLPVLFCKVKQKLSGICRVLIMFCLSCIGGMLCEIVFSRLNGSPILWTRWLIFFSAVYVIVFSLKYRNIILDFPEKFCLLSSLTIGMSLCILFPLTSYISYDDGIHFARTLCVAKSGEAMVMTDAESNIQYTAFWDLSDSRLSLDERLNIKEQLNDLDENCEVVYNPENLLSLSIISYYPMAIGIWTGRILGLPFSIDLILGRIGNLVFYSFMMYFAIRRLRYGKIIFLVFALLPTSLFLASNYSYDPWVTEFFALGTAYFVGALQRKDEELTKIESVIIIGSFFLGNLPKAAYFFVCLIPLLMPKEKFRTPEDRKRYCIYSILFFMMSVAVCFCPFIFSATLSNGKIGDLRGGEAVDSIGQVKFILTHPVKYTMILLMFLRDYLSIENASKYISDFAYIGFSNVHTLPIAMLLFSALTDNGYEAGESVKWRARLVNAVILFITLSFCATTLYISFTSVGAETIAGFQPRYLLPLILPFLLITVKTEVPYKVNRWIYNGIFYFFSTYCLISVVWDLLGNKITM